MSALLALASIAAHGADSGSGAGKASGLDAELQRVQQAERDSDAEAQAVAGQFGGKAPEAPIQVLLGAGKAGSTAKAGPSNSPVAPGTPRISGSRIDPRAFGREPIEGGSFLERLKQIPRKPLNIPTPAYQPTEREGDPGSVQYGEVAGEANPAGFRGALPYLPTLTPRLPAEQESSPMKKKRNFHGPASAPRPSLPKAAAERKAVKKGFNNSVPPERAQALPWLRSAESKMQSGDFDGALEDAQQAIRIDSENAAAHLLLAQALSALGRFEEAEQAALRSVRLDPGNASAYEVLAWAQLNLGEDRQAAASASQVLLLDPGNAFAYAIRAYAYERLGQDSAKMRDLAAAARMNPAAFGAQLQRARAGRKVAPLSAAKARADENSPAAPSRFMGTFLFLGLVLPLLVAAAYFIFIHLQKARLNS